MTQPAISSTTPKKVAIVLALLIAGLLALHFWSYYYTLSNDLSTENWYFRKLNFGEEKNAPSIFSTLLYVIISLLLFKIATSDLTIKKHRVFWISLGVIFLFLGADELLRIHEKIGGAFSENVETSGIFYYSWVIPYGIALIILGIFIVKPLFSLPRRTLISFIVAGSIFIIGAVGFEMIGGWYIENNITDYSTMYTSRAVFMLYTIEETLEMIGLSGFIYALLVFQVKYVTRKEL